MEDVRIPRPVVASSSPLQEERRTAALIAQYIHELSSRHADDRAVIRESGGA